MALFRRKKGRVDVDESAPPGTDVDEERAAEQAADERPTEGPWDSAAAPDDELPRLDLGALLVPGFPGMELRLEIDRATDRVVAATAVLGDAQLQLQAFAAPRSGGLWKQVRAEILAGLEQAGGRAEEVDGRFGPELTAQVPGDAGGLQPARFVGVDGRRWFLRGLFSGAAAEPGDATTQLEEVFAGTVVVRGDQAMAPRDLLQLHLPEQAPQATDAGSGWTSMEPLRRGPEITEIH